MLNPACFLVLLSSLFLSFILSRFPFFYLRLAVRASVAPTVWRWSAAVAGVGAFAVAGLSWVGLLSTVSVCRGGQDRSAVVAVAVRLAPRLYGRGGRGCGAGVATSAFRSVDRRGGRAVRPSCGRSVAGRVVARRFGCAGRRESVARALRSASGGGGGSGGSMVGRACLRLVSPCFNFLMSTFWL